MLQCIYNFFFILRIKLRSNRKEGKERSIWIGRWRQTSIVIFRETSEGARSSRMRRVRVSLLCSRDSPTPFPFSWLRPNECCRHFESWRNRSRWTSLKNCREVLARLLCISLKSREEILSYLSWLFSLRHFMVWIIDSRSEREYICVFEKRQSLSEEIIRSQKWLHVRKCSFHSGVIQYLNASLTMAS